MRARLARTRAVNLEKCRRFVRRVKRDRSLKRAESWQRLNGRAAETRRSIVPQTYDFPFLTPDAIGEPSTNVYRPLVTLKNWKKGCDEDTCVYVCLWEEWTSGGIVSWNSMERFLSWSLWLFNPASVRFEITQEKGTRDPELCVINLHLWIIVGVSRRCPCIDAERDGAHLNNIRKRKWVRWN